MAYRVDNATSVPVMPTPSAVGPNPDSFFSRGNPTTDTPATIVEDHWLNAFQEEICNVITDAGITLSKTTQTQLRDAYKKTIQFSKPVWALDTGAANAYVVALTPAITAYAAGLRITFVPSNTNTTASTIAVNGLAAKAIKRSVNVAVGAGDIIANQVTELVYDGTNFQVTTPLPNLLKSVNVIAFGTPGTTTYTPSAGLISAKVELIGGGGGGGGATGGGAGTASAGSGGGPGGYISKTFTKAQIGASQSITIGAGGAGGAAGNNAGSNGGDTIFGAYSTGQGGIGGGGCPSSSAMQVTLGGASGQGIGANDFISNGTPGGNGMTFPASAFALGGNGGQSFLGGGTQSSVNAAGIPNPQGVGCGGGGGSAILSSNGGGAGTNGAIIITEYISQ